MSTESGLKKMIGARLRGLMKKDYTWFFAFTDGVSILTEDRWRLLSKEQIEVTSEDHLQKFGLPGPLDAAEQVRGMIGDGPIVDARVNPRTGDLSLVFTDQVELEFLQTSSGYEAWRATVPGDELICGGAGRVQSLKDGDYVVLRRNDPPVH